MINYLADLCSITKQVYNYCSLYSYILIYLAQCTLLICTRVETWWGGSGPSMEVHDRRTMVRDYGGYHGGDYGGDHYRDHRGVLLELITSINGRFWFRSFNLNINKIR